MRVEPRRDLAERLCEVPLSSYQFEALVASSEGWDMVGAVEGACDSRGRSVATAEDAFTAPFCLRRLIRWPCSFSEDVKPESESEAGGGVAGRFRKLDFPFAGRFLNVNCGVSWMV